MSEKLSRFYIRIADDFGTLTVCWLRQILSDSESLLTPYAKHRFFELHYVLDGGINIHTEKKDFTVGAGDFLLIAPGHYHSITAFAPSTRKFVFAFDVRLADAAVAQNFAKVGLAAHRETEALRKMADLLIVLPGGAPSVAGAQIRCLTEAFFLELLKIVLPEASVGFDAKLKADSRSELVERMYALIRSRLGAEIPSVEEIAEAFNISRRHLSRITAETVGKTPRQILDEERLSYIRELLATTDYTMNEIAFLSGFSSEYSLARFFREKENCTLNKYRKDTML